MSQENLELVYRGFDAWTRHDLDEALAGSDPDVELTPVMGPASTTYRGHEGMRTWANDLFSTFVLAPLNESDGWKLRPPDVIIGRIKEAVRKVPF